MTLAIISHPDCEKHDAGVQHPERPQRVVTIQNALKKYPFAGEIQFHDALDATKADLMRAHDPDYVEWLYSVAPKTESIQIDPDTIMNPATLSAALKAAGAVILAVDLVMGNRAQAVFCNVRPPGHHAEHAQAMGFCFFNNVAVGVHYALAIYQLQRIAIIDFDVHHGNGTQNIFQREPRVLLCSSFEHPLYPGFDEELDNDHIIAVPLPPGTTGVSYREAVQAAWFEKIKKFAPQLIFFSAGFDAHANDPLANLELQKSDYVWVTEEIAKIAKECCQGKMISVLEGGYDLEALAECVPAHVAAMIPSQHPHP